MTRLDDILAYTERHRIGVFAVSALLIAATAWIDILLPSSSVGFLYLFAILLTAPAMGKRQIFIAAAVCAFLRETLDPLQSYSDVVQYRLLALFEPSHWAAGSAGRFIVAMAGFAMTGLFVSELNQRRRLLLEHLTERDRQIRLRQEAERQLRILIDTSPLAILTLDAVGRVELANESASQLLGFDGTDALPGKTVDRNLPILHRMLQSQNRGGNMRTNVECKGLRQNGEIFLAHIWLSTYQGSAGPRLAAVIWDASENVRDREGAGLDSMMATSRVLIGAIAHEIRNLASAAANSYAALGAAFPAEQLAGLEHYQVLGSLIRALEKIASSGLRVAADRGRAIADLGTVLDETRVVIEPALREKGVEVIWEIAPGLPLVQSDHHSLLQVFVNLARNSGQALEHAARRELRISAGFENDLVLVRFHDTGPGIAHPEELFRPFQPGAHSFGLGLYISRAILRSQGGSLRHEPSQPGCCFAVELWPAENTGEE
jgi:two-component system sensor kinase FixL